MSINESQSPEPQLDFERAEFARKPEISGPDCGYCKKAVHDEYWQVGKLVACVSCRNQIAAHFTRADSAKSFFGALQYGALAAAAGSVAWIIVAKVTGYELGILAIGIGYFVGKAVRKGSQGAGGPRYQALAMFLTYASITLASLPPLLAALAERQHDAPAVAHAAPSFLGTLWAWMLIIGITFASPFLAGIQNVMGIIIIAIGLYEAWKFTRRVSVSILGPYPVDPAAARSDAIASGAVSTETAAEEQPAVAGVDAGS